MDGEKERIMPLEQLQIRNFQCHKNRKIDFDPLVTVLTGPSDSGKSAIIRALRWACTNSPGGDAFVRDGAKRCGVRLKIDGRVIGRTKGTSENEYTLDGKKYKSFGTNVPEPIVNLLNLSPVTWQGQHDSPFWLAETAGQVGRELNTIVNLEAMDDALAAVNRLVSKDKARSEVAAERLVGAQERLQALSWVEEAKEDMGELETFHSLHGGIEASYGRLYSLFADAFGERARADTLRNVEGAAREVVLKGEHFVEFKVKAHQLSAIIEGVGELGSIEAPDLTELEEAKESWEEATEHFESLQELVTVVEAQMAAVDQLSVMVDRQKEELEESLEGRCPLCGAETGDLL